jgi:hypothetical protein
MLRTVESSGTRTPPHRLRTTLLWGSPLALPRRASFSFERNNMLCGKWMILSDGCVARCDKKFGHDKPNDHVDSVIAINFTDRDVEATKRRLAGSYAVAS